MPLNQRIMADTRIEIQADLGDDRIIAKIAVDLIWNHPLLSKIRGKSPEIERLQMSMQKTGDTAVYPILLYASETNEGVAEPNTTTQQSPESDLLLSYYIADGHQRLRAARNNGNTHIVAQIITRWNNAEDAFHECVQLQYARFEMRDIDLFSILREGRLTDQELLGLTGKSESTITRMRKVCGHKLLTELIDQHCLTTNVAARLIDKCNKNEEKIKSLLDTLAAKRVSYQREADHWANKFAVEGSRPKNKKLAAMDQLATYFEREDWTHWEDVLDTKDRDSIDPASGCLNLKADAAVAKASIRVDDRGTLWEDEIAIYFDGGQKHNDMTIENLQAFRDQLPTIGTQLDAIIRRRKKLEAVKEIPIPSSNPTVPIAPPEPPASQSTEMDVEND